MEPISNTDRIVAILRQRLRESARQGAPKGPSTPDKARLQQRGGLSAVAMLPDASPEQLRRACVQALLSEQLGNGLLNDAQFQQVVTRVTEMIESDPTALGLLDRVLATLKPV